MMIAFIYSRHKYFTYTKENKNTNRSTTYHNFNIMLYLYLSKNNLGVLKQYKYLLSLYDNTFIR